MLLSSSPLVYKIFPFGVFEGGDSLVDGVSPGLTVSSKSRQLVVVNVASTQGLFKIVFVPFLWGSSVMCYGREDSAPWNTILGRR